MKRLSFQQFVQAGAKEILKGIAQDLLLCEKSAARPLLWQDALRIEKRFWLQGFTMTWLTWIEYKQKAFDAIRCLSQPRFELDEHDELAIYAAQSTIRDFVGIYGQSAFDRLKSSL